MKRLFLFSLAAACCFVAPSLVAAQGAAPPLIAAVSDSLTQVVALVIAGVASYIAVLFRKWLVGVQDEDARRLIDKVVFHGLALGLQRTLPSNLPGPPAPAAVTEVVDIARTYALQSAPDALKRLGVVGGDRERLALIVASRFDEALRRRNLTSK